MLTLHRGCESFGCRGAEESAAVLCSTVYRRSGILIRDVLEYYTDVFSRTVGEKNIGILVRSYDGELLSFNDRLLELAGTQKSASDVTIDDVPWKGLKQESDAADILAKVGDVREAVSLYFHPVLLDWVQGVSVKFSYQSSAACGQPPKWGGQPVIYILLMDVGHLSGSKFMTYKAWGDAIRVDYEKNRVFFEDNSILSRNDLICLSYYLDNMSQSAIAKTMNQSVKTVEKRIANLKATLLKFDPDCENLHIFCRTHGLRQVFEMKRDWFDQRPVAWQITNMQWQSFVPTRP